MPANSSDPKTRWNKGRSPMSRFSLRCIVGTMSTKPSQHRKATRFASASSEEFAMKPIHGSHDTPCDCILSVRLHLERALRPRVRHRKNGPAPPPSAWTTKELRLLFSSILGKVECHQNVAVECPAKPVKAMPGVVKTPKPFKAMVPAAFKP